MFEGFKKRQLDNLLSIKESEIAIRYLDIVEAQTLKSIDKLKDRDEDDWTDLGATSERELSESDSATLREQAAKFYYRNGHARNIIRLFEKYVVGRGFQVSPMSTIEAVAEVWKEFWEVNKLALKKKEVVRRVMRDGEIFIRYFINKADVLVMRFCNPDKIKDPDKKEAAEVRGICTHGIETNPDDVEDVLAYWYKGERIPAEEIDHHKILVDSDIKRGRSLIEIVAVYLTLYKDWLKDRMRLNKVRAAVALIKKVSGTPTQAANIATASRVISSQKTAPDNTGYHKAPEGVSVFTTNQGVDYEMASPNLQASDVRHDGRAILLAMATAVGLPEFMATGDASNSNYASTLVAEGPAVMEFEDWQDYFAIVFKAMFDRVMQHSLKKGGLPKQEKRMVLTIEKVEGVRTAIEKEETVDINLDCNIVFPDIVARDVEKETRALSLQKQEGWISNHTACASLDLDYDKEQEMILLEEENEVDEEPEPEDLEEEGEEEEEEKPPINKKPVKK